jgi:hypothetical protein
MSLTDYHCCNQRGALDKGPAIGATALCSIEKTLA